MSSPAECTAVGGACAARSRGAGTAKGVRARRATAHSAGRARAPGAALTGEPHSSGGEQVVVLVQELIGGDEAVNAQPWLARCRTQQRHGGMAHLVAAVGAEGLLHGDAGGYGAPLGVPVRA